MCWLQVFVDEYTCIGCKNCTAVCDKTFSMEEEFGRAQVISQARATPAIKQEAIDTCPVRPVLSSSVLLLAYSYIWPMHCVRLYAPALNPARPKAAWLQMY